MNGFCRATAVLGLLLAGATARAGTAVSSSDGMPSAGIPVTQLIAMVAKKTGKKFLVDPRVQANVLLIGQDLTSVS